MSELTMTRRFFIGGAAFLWALFGVGGIGCFADGSGGAPRLRFGVVSDIYFVYNTDGVIPSWGPATLESMRYTTHKGKDAYETTRLYTRFSKWNKDTAAFGKFQFVE